MSKTDPASRRTDFYKSEPKSKQKYATDLGCKSNLKDNLKVSYDTTLVDKFASRISFENDDQLRNKKKFRFCDKKRQQEATRKTYFSQFGSDEFSSQFDYLRNNLCIKTCIANQKVVKLQMTKITFRNYTPKILSQEVNIGMWI